MSKKERRREKELEKEEKKVISLDQKLEEKKEEKKTAAEVVKAAEEKVKEEKPGKELSLETLAKWSSNQSRLITELCKKVSNHDNRLEKIESDVAELKEYFEDDDEDDDEEPDVEEEEEEAEDEEPEESEEPEMYLGVIIPEKYTGPAFAYLYLDEEAKKFIETSSLLYAEAAAKDYTKWKVMPAWYEGGHIDHLLSTAELKKYAPR